MGCNESTEQPSSNACEDSYSADMNTGGSNTQTEMAPQRRSSSIDQMELELNRGGSFRDGRHSWPILSFDKQDHVKFKNGQTVLAYYKDDNAWYPAVILSRKSAGFLVQYKNKRFIDTVSTKHFRKMQQDSKSRSVNDLCDISSCHEVTGHSLWKCWSQSSTQSANNSADSMTGDISENFIPGKDILSYCKDDAEWHPARIIARRTLGYLVRFDDDGRTETLPRKYIKLRPTVSKNIGCAYSPLNKSPLSNRDKMVFHFSEQSKDESSLKRSCSEKRSLIPIGADVLVFNRNFCIWYPAKLAAIKATGYLIQYNDDKFLEIVPEDCIKFMPVLPGNTPDENGSSYQIYSKYRKVVLTPRDATVEHEQAGIFTMNGTIPLGEDKLTHKKHKKRCPKKLPTMKSLKAGTAALVYFQPDKKWYPAKIISKKPCLGYLVRYDGDGFVEVVPGSYVDRNIQEYLDLIQN